MIRYEGGPLPPRPQIAIVANDAIGNFVVCTPLAQALQAKFPDCSIDYYGGTRTRELQLASDLFRSTHCLFGVPPSESFKLAACAPVYDLVVNVESSATARLFAAALAGPETQVVGPCMDAQGRKELAVGDTPQGRLLADMGWIDEDITDRHPFLKTGFIGEMYCRLCYLEGDIPPYKLPTEDPGSEIPDILIAMSASLPEKIWPSEKWQETLTRLKKEGATVGLIGGPVQLQQGLYKGSNAEADVVERGLCEDLRGQFSLPQVVGALSKAKAILTLDNGILHLAVGGGKPVVGLYRHGIHRLWAPPYPNLTVITPGEGKPVSDIEVDAVLGAMLHAV